MMAWPRYCLLWALLLAAGAVTLIRCHSGGSGGVTIPPSICEGAGCFSGRHYDVRLRISPYGTTDFRRTGGCLAKTKVTPAIYDGCILRSDMAGELVLEFKLCEIGDEFIVTVIDKTSADLYPAEKDYNTLLARKADESAEYEDCWTSQGAPPPPTVETPCFSNMIDPHNIGADRFMVKGDLKGKPHKEFWFQKEATQSTGVTGYDAFLSGAPLFPWFASNQQSGNFCPGGNLTGGWTERIQVGLDLTFIGDSVSGTFTFTDRDPDRTATRQCLNWCPTYINPGGPNCPGGPVQRNFCPFANTSPTSCGPNWVYELRFYDLFPYCNPYYLTRTFGPSPASGCESCGFFNLIDGTTRHTCDYADCPPWVWGMEDELREFPFCARVVDLPCVVCGDCADIDCTNDIDDDGDTFIDEFDCTNGFDDDSDGLVDEGCDDCADIDCTNDTDDDGDTFIDEFDCANGIDDDGDGLTDELIPEWHCTGVSHADNIIVGGGGSDAQKDMAAETCSSLTSADILSGRCFVGPAPCCNGAPHDTSWEKCRDNGVRPLSQPPFSGYAIPFGSPKLSDLDYKCPLDSPPSPARYRNRLLPFDCDSAYAENCIADDVTITFDVSGTLTYREAAPTCP
ncbi:MAG: hypothetical protein JSV08_09955 [Acidobacteriota bacterium]|nr:MAG: hypothetical protein JSV08_09955 [Acidobacteriota bacterium]